MTKKGFVVLVGAGPGDLELLTLGGKKHLERAEVVLYDRLVAPEILALAPAEAEKIDVGKEKNHHAVPQSAINQLLLEKALAGKRVVRLKGGDPFLFGRGGEELELLIKHEIPFRVIPGVTSAVAVPAYAGIPVTHRDFCSSVHIITGHKKNHGELDIDFEALVATGGTLVFMMSVSSLPKIIAGLTSAGMDLQMPAAIIENGSKASQRKVVATVETLYKRSQEEGIKSPAVIVVGKVCQLSDSFDWFAKRSLVGERIIVTRPQASGGTLSEKLRKLGAKVIDYPCIKIRPLKENTVLAKAVSNIQDYQWLVFTSKNGVDIFFDYLKEINKDSRILFGLKIAAIGSQTAQTLAKYGLLTDYMPSVYEGTHLAEGLVQVVKPGEKILLARAEMGSQEIPRILKENHRFFDDVPVYQTIYSSPESKQIATLLREHPKTLVTFTSASTVHGFVGSLGAYEKLTLRGICIGSQTAKAAQRYGLNHFIAEEATIDSMIAKIKEVHHEGRKTQKATTKP